MLIDGGLPVIETLEANDLVGISGVREALALGVAGQDLADGGPGDVCAVVGDDAEANFGTVRRRRGDSVAASDQRRAFRQYQVAYPGIVHV